MGGGCEAQGGPRAAQATPGGSSGNPSRELRGAPGRKVAKTVRVLHGLEGPKGASEDDGAKTLKNYKFLRGSGAQVAKTVRVLHGLGGPKGASEGGGAETL